jgi:polysaccharide export outer membrane protein
MYTRGDNGAGKRDRRKRMFQRLVAVSTLMLITVFAATPEESRYKLRSGDSILLNFVYVPEFNHTLTVQPDGYITLRGIGDLRAGGLSVAELEKAIELSYGPIMKDPDVSVELKDFEKPFFLAQGELQKPGKYELRGNITLSEAVAIAGGLNPGAKHSQVLLFRRSTAGEVAVREIDLKRVLRGKDLTGDVNIRPGDMVFVPKSRLSKIRDYANLTYLRLLLP